MWQGAIVRSKCGRDRYRVFAVIGICEDGRVLIADGDLHKLSSPKKKNLSHLTVLAAEGAALTSLCSDDDKGLHKFLREFEENCEKHHLKS